MSAERDDDPAFRAKLTEAIEAAPKVSTNGFMPHARFMFEAGMAYREAELTALREPSDEMIERAAKALDDASEGEWSIAWWRKVAGTALRSALAANTDNTGEETDGR